MNDANNEERLQKVLARAGIASRRACEELITAGRVRVNGKVVTQLGVKINPAQDKILVDEHPVAVKPGTTPKKIYLMLNKPAGYLSTVSDPQGRPTIMDLVEIEERLYPVGRLDAETEGLLLLTNDGSFAQSLSHPRFGVEKEYLAVLDGRPPLKELERLRKGIKIPVENPETGELEEQVTQPAKVDLVGYEGSNSLIRFVIKEGKKRQVRLMARAIGFSTLNLKRVRFGPLPLADLDEGKTRPLSKAEIKSLLQAANGERVTIQNKPNSRSANKGDPTTAGKKRPNEEHLRPDFKERQPERRPDFKERQNAGKRPDNDQFQPFRRPVSDERPHFDRRTPSLSDRRPANDERQPFRRPSNDDRRLPNEERPIFQRPVSNERPHFDRNPNNEPPFRRPVADERPPFRRPVNDRPINDNRISNNNEQPFRRPATDERPPFRRPATDERPPFRRPVTDERPPFRRPVTDERPPF
ncbi:MAG: pseudouridine synthase, partial [Chloroflexota bacterium]